MKESVLFFLLLFLELHDGDDDLVGAGDILVNEGERKLGMRMRGGIGIAIGLR
jgi:hypothetical protein